MIARLARRPGWGVGSALVAGFILGSPGSDRPSPARSGVTAARAADSLAVIISEVLFDPRPGEAPFVELLNVGTKPVDLTAMVLRVDTLDLPLPRLESPLAPGARAVVRFDGQAEVEGSTIHAGGYALLREAGSLALLRNDDSPLDRVGWGAAATATVAFEGAIGQPRVEAGSSLGRPPGSGRGGEWVTYPPALVTPGAVNPLLPVPELLPLDGAIVEETMVELAWYPAAGAIRYRVQLARDSSFATPLLDRTVDEPTVSAELGHGVYWWRVEAAPEEGAAASWSHVNRLEVAAPTPSEAPSGIGLGTWGAPHAVGSPARSVRLSVPYLTQHKDTRMLVLESPIQTGAHAWDADHRVPSRTDGADTKNCAVANVAMINRFYGGDLSQDRIGYEVLSHRISRYLGAIQASPLSFALTDLRFASHLRERAAGPEQDLVYRKGLETLRVFAAFTYALGAAPDFVGSYPSKDSIWTDVTAELDAGRPLVGANTTHMFVIRGYEVRGKRRLLFVNDPARGRYAVDLDAATLPAADLSMFTFPRRGSIARQEPEVSRDTDRDGVVDFDETQRFRTSPTNPDSDGDGVKDKEDIASGVFEKEFGRGYAYNNAEIGRDYDGDQLPTEIDPDSDQGGCEDGDEDINGSGVREGSETSNFSDGDDVCELLDGSVTYTIHAVNPTPDSPVKEIFDRGTIQVRLKPDRSSPGRYVDKGSTFSYRGYARLEVPGGCLIWGREVAQGAGRFVGAGNEIGATRGDDGTMALGAIASVPGYASSGGCGGQGGRGPAERTMSFPDCSGRLARTSAGRKLYRFDCTTKPNLGPGWTVTTFVARGWVQVL